MRIGKCQKCKKIYHWPDNANSWRLACPKCDSPLKRTTISISTELVELKEAPYKKIGAS